MPAQRHEFPTPPNYLISARTFGNLYNDDPHNEREKGQGFFHSIITAQLGVFFQNSKSSQ